MKKPKDCHQEAYKPICVGNGIWMPSDTIDYNSKETFAKKYNQYGGKYYEIKNGFEERTTLFKYLPADKYIHNINSNLVKKLTYHYKSGRVLQKITYISCLDNFEQEHIDKEYFYENDNVICLHYSYDKPLYYEITSQTKDKKIVEYWKKDRTPYRKVEYYYNAGKLITEVAIVLPGHYIEQYWEYKYDDRGNPILIQRYNNRRIAEHCRLYEFDDYNNCIKEQMVFKPSGRLLEDYRNQYEYDKQGNWLRKVMYKNDEIQWFVDNKCNTK